MAMTAAERQRVIDLLDELDKQKRGIVIASLQKFADWLRVSLRPIYEKVKYALSEIWDSLKELFS